MTIRVKNQFLCSLLYSGERICSAPLICQINELARILLIPLITIHVSRYLNKTGISDIKVHTRHGVTEKMGYKLFSSDIDYTAILRNDSSPSVYQEIARAYQRLAQVNLALGELQMLNQRESKELREIQSKYKALIDLINDTRKIANLENLQNEATSKYHRTRARSSLLRVIKRRFPNVIPSEHSDTIDVDWTNLSQDFGDELNRLIDLFPTKAGFKETLSDLCSKYKDSLLNLDIFSPYFNAYISGRSKPKQQLNLAPQTLLVLLAILPPGTQTPRALWLAIKHLRGSAPLGDIYRATLKYEAINSLATLRPKSSCTRNEIRHIINLKACLKAYKVNFENLTPWIEYFYKSEKR